MAADEASFSTEMFSTSAGVRSLSEPGMPSINTSGLGVAPNEPTPRMRMVPASWPGLPLDWVMVTPGIRPVSMLDTSGTERDSISLLSMVEMEPMTFTFFWMP